MTLVCDTLFFGIAKKNNSRLKYLSVIDQESVLVYATAHGKFNGLDLRSMDLAWSFDSPASHGVITTFTMDRHHSWALTGTSRGVFSLWDIRFGLRVKSWAHPSRSKVLNFYPFSLVNDVVVLLCNMN